MVAPRDASTRHDGEGAEVDHGVHQRIRLDLADVDVGAASGQRHQQVAGLRDRRPGEQPDRVLLAQRGKVADRHGERGRDRHDDRPGVDVRREHPGQHHHQTRQAGDLADHRQVRSDGHRRTDVRVRNPHLERHDRDLEGQPDDGEHHRDPITGFDGRAVAPETATEPAATDPVAP